MKAWIIFLCLLSIAVIAFAEDSIEKEKIAGQKENKDNPSIFSYKKMLQALEKAMSWFMDSLRNLSDQKLKV